MAAMVHSAGISDSKGAKRLIATLYHRFPRLKKLWADTNYQGQLVDWVDEAFGWDLEIVSKPPDQIGFSVIPVRWIVERTFAWFGNFRRLSKDYEAVPESSEAMLFVAMIHLMLRRLAPPQPA